MTEALAERLRRDNDRAVRAAAAIGLGRLGPSASRAAPAMVEALETDDSESVRIAVVRVLGAIGPEGATGPALVRAARADGAIDVRDWATQSLGRVAASDEAAFRALIDLLGDPEPVVRRVAARALGDALQTQTADGNEAPQGFDALAVPTLVDADEDVRRVAGYALGHRDRRAAQTALAETPELGAMPAREAAARGLVQARFDSKETVEALARALGDGNARVRLAAAEMLAWHGDLPGGAADALHRAATDPDRAVRNAAARALWAIIVASTRQ